MKFYFAGPFAYGQRLKDFRDELYRAYPRKHGIVPIFVTSTWIDIPPGTRSNNAFEAAAYAAQDLRDVDEADMLLLFNPPGFPQSPGRNIEFGYAMAKGKRLGIVGKAHGVFQYLPGIERFKHIEDLGHWFSVMQDDLLSPYEG